MLHHCNVKGFIFTIFILLNATISFSEVKSNALIKADSFVLNSEFDSAFFYYLIVEKELSNSNDAKNAAILHQRMALWYNRQKMPIKALENIDKAILLMEGEDSNKLAHYHLTKSNIYLKQHKYDSAKLYVDKAQQLDHKDTLLQMLIYTHKYQHAVHHKDTAQQLTLLEKAYLISLTNDRSKKHRSWISLALARLNKRKGNYNQSIKLLKFSLVHTTPGHFKLLAAIHDELSICYWEKTMPDSAYYYSRIQVRYLKAAYQKKIQEKSLELEAKYDAGLKKEQLDKLHLKQVYNQKKEKLLYVVICISFLLILALFWGVISYRNSLKANKEISKEKLLKSEQKAKLQAINSMVRGQEMERGRLARELHDGIAGSMLLVKMAMEKNNKNNSLNDPISHISNSIKAIRDLSRTIVPLALDKFGLAIALEDLVSRLRNTGTPSITLSITGIDDKNSLNGEIELHTYRCIEEAALNSLKHADATEIFISIIKTDNWLNITVEDDGKGFDNQQIKTGLGLNNIQTRAQIMRATCHIESSQKKGTTIILNIPTGNTSLKTTKK